MRTGLNTIQQTLTTEAATVLTQSIADAGRRHHTQTTPLHVANTLLSSPSGFLRQACIRSHPNSSHPLQCRALELCFSVALDRLPAATSSPATTDPPVSNALMAALKRAQAHQRRGCPENQQQPLLAVKVELEQLIVSILDDPSVSRVMREASFSSPAVKATIEQSLIKPGISPVSGSVNRNLYLNPRLLQQKQGNETGEGAIEQSLSKPLSRPGVSPGNLYLNPRLLQQKQGEKQGNETGEGRVCEEVNRVIEIMGKEKRKNPILVGESEPETIRNQILQRVESGEFVINKESRKIDVISISISFDGLLNLKKIKELGGLIEERIVGFDGGKGVVVDLGDLKWLVERPPGTVMGSSGRESVAEMGRLVEKFAGKVWLIGTATCETFLRCQVYYPSMESDWDLQAVPITSRSPFPNMLPRMGTNGVLGGSVQSFNRLNSISTNMNLDPGRKIPICPKCSSDYEQEVEKLKQFEVKNSLPQWLQNATTKEQSQNKDQELDLKLKIEELQKKWRDECFRIHPNYNQSSRLDRVVPMMVPLTGAYKPNMLLQQSKTSQQPRLEPPRSPVGTDLFLGPKKPSETTKDDQNLAVKDLLGCISSEPQKGKFVNSADTDYFKKLLKGLMKQCWWQPEAASAIATTITQCKVETGSRGCVWLLFAGPDRVGKKKMASVLSEHITGTNPITIGLGSKRDYDETDTGFRGKTVLDRIVDAVRRNQSSVIVLSDIDEADILVRGSIKRAMERGRLTDSYGREISLGNVVFVVTGNWSTANKLNTDEQRLHAIATRDWQLKLTISEKRLKRKANWLLGNNKSTKPRKEPGLDLSLDLNLNLGIIDYDEDRTDGSIGSINSSNLTIDNEGEDQQFAISVSVPHDLLRPSDAAVVFKPVDFGSLRVEIEKTIRNAFSTIVDRVDRVTTFEVEEGAVEDILGGLWFGRMSLEEWAEQVLVPSLHQVDSRLTNRGEDLVVRLESDRDRVRVCIGENWLPGKIEVVVDGV